MPRELEERHPGKILEERRGESGIRARLRASPADLLRVAGNLVFRQAHAIDLHPFAEMDEMRRGVESRPPAGGMQDRLDHGGNGPLAVGAGHMHAWELAFGMAQFRRQEPHPVDAVDLTLRFEGEQPVDDRLVS